MALKLKRVGDLVKGPEKRKPYRDAPLLGAVQAMILKKLDDLRDNASGWSPRLFGVRIWREFPGRELSGRGALAYPTSARLDALKEEDTKRFKP
jgi:hypothetical protein